MQMFDRSAGNRSFAALWILTVPAMYLVAQYNYLLFHSTVELFSIVVAVAMFFIALNTHRYIDDGYLALLGIAYFPIAGVDLVRNLLQVDVSILSGSG